MQKTGKAFALIAITAAVITALLFWKDEEVTPAMEATAPVVAASEAGPAPAQGWRVEEQGGQEYRDDGTTHARPLATREEHAGNAQAHAVQGGTNRTNENRDVVRRETTQQMDAAREAFEELPRAAATDRDPRASRDAPEDKRFDYAKIQRLYVLKGDEGYAYATHPTFLQYRALIVEKMSNAGESNVDFTKMIYEIRAIGIGEETTLFVGDSWIDDGESSAELSGEELNWLRDAYEMRTSRKPSDRQWIERAIRLELEGQKDPAWRPDP